MRYLLTVLLGLAACSSPDSASFDGGFDTGTDALVAPNTAYESAVLGATWTKLVNAPSVSGGQKQDDIFFLGPKLG